MRITIMGAGSATFTRSVVSDILTYPALQEAELVLMDIDPRALDRAARLVRTMVRDRGVPATVEATLDRRAALAGADFVLLTFMIGGWRAYRADIEIPARYGVLQSVGDSIGPGGVMRLLRNAPVLTSIAADLAELAPEAWVLNYVNPMAMSTWMLLDAGHARTVGLCHSVQTMYRSIAGWLGLPPDEIRYRAGGINHVDFYLSLTHRGRDLYPDFLAARHTVCADAPHMRILFDLVEYLGHVPAEGPGHQVEYYPWFRKNEAMAQEYAIRTGGAYARDAAAEEARSVEIEDQIAGRKPLPVERSSEYAARILNAVVTGSPEIVYGNVRNAGLIDNLPPEAVVEVPCLVDAAGVQPCRVGRLPPQLAAVMRPHVGVHELAIEGVRSGDRRRIEQAIACDPLSGAILTWPQIRAMTAELLAANAGVKEELTP